MQAPFLHSFVESLNERKGKIQQKLEQNLLFHLFLLSIVAEYTYNAKQVDA